MPTMPKIPHPADLPRLDLAALADLAAAAATPAKASPLPCPCCAPLVCPGWESMPSSLDPDALRVVGTLIDTRNDDPTLAEYHPNGTHQWSPDAPIAPDFYPYNRCNVWVCTRCARPFLRYTEYGGYYEDERVRALNAGLLDDATVA